MSESFKEKLARLGYELPSPPSPKGSYLPVRRVGDLLFTSGTGANINGTRLFTGTVGKSVSVEDAQKSAKYALLNNLANIYSEIGEDMKYLRILKLTGYVSSSPEFHDQAKVINGASDVLFEIFGENGRHARSAIGVSSLPFDLSVEIEMVVFIDK